MAIAECLKKIKFVHFVDIHLKFAQYQPLDLFGPIAVFD